MDYFKFNLIYKNDSNTFQELMNKIFSNFVKQKIESDDL